MSRSPFSHSHMLNIPTATTESIPQTPSELKGPQTASWTNQDFVQGPDRDSTVAGLQQHAADNDHAQMHGPLRTDTASHSHALGISALDAVPSTPVQSGVEGVPSTPISRRAPRRATRTGRRFSVAEDHDEEEEGDGKSDFITQAAMMLGVMAGHLVSGYVMHEEPSSEKDGHDDDEKDDA